MREARRSTPIERADETDDTAPDVETLILRGHLLVEEALHAAVHSKFEYPHYLADADLTFAQLLSIAKAVYFSEGDAAVWDAMEALNSLRNRLARASDPSADAEDLRRIGVMMPVPEKVSLYHPDAPFLLNAGLGAMLGFLHGVLPATTPREM